MVRYEGAGRRPRRCCAGFGRIAALLALCCVGFLCPSRAQWTPRVEVRVVSPGAPLPPGEVLVNGGVVLRLRSDLAGYLPEQRAGVAAERLRALVAAGVKPADVLADVDTDRANPRLKALGQVIAIATADEAKEAGLSPAGLVRSWAQSLRRALALPGLTVSAERVVVPVGETRVLRLGGAARGPVTVATAGAGTKVAAATPDPVTGSVTLRGVDAGKETLTLAREGASVEVTVLVQRYAGRIGKPRPVVMTGASVPADLVARHVLANALAAARLSPGASAQVAAPTVPVLPLAQGQRQTLEVPLELGGPHMIPVRGTVRVPVVSRKLPPAATAALLYSNNPERVREYGTLFVGRLTKDKGAIRLLYHHQSAMDKAAWFTVELINDGSAPATVHVLGGSAGPVLDTVWVGVPPRSFCATLLQDLGAVLEVPAGSRVALTVQRLPPGLTISGLAQLRQLEGDPLLVRVAADVPGDARAASTELVPTPSPWGGEMAGLLSEHVYPDPQKALKAEYRAGERWTFLSVGRSPIKGVDGERRLEGNFGVFYDIELTLENPTDKAAPAQIVFEPSAGLAGGIFLMDGRPVEIPQADLPAEITLARYTLPPGAKQTVHIKTLPLSGSNYPIRLTVRP